MQRHEKFDHGDDLSTRLTTRVEKLEMLEFRIQVYRFYDLPKVSFIYSGGRYPKKEK